MIARFRMLQCGNNYKGTMNHICDTCDCLDDEEHRLNWCSKFAHNNFRNNPDKIEFDTIYSDDICTIRNAISRIRTVWDVSNGNGSMINI